MILVTGVSGSLGGLIHAGLAALPDLDVVTGTRSGDGSAARRIDFDDPDSLAGGFSGIDVLVFISAGYAEDDVVMARHSAVVDAATTAGVRHVVYTSLAHSGRHMTIAAPHRSTEALLRSAPFDVTVLRDGLYPEVPVGLGLAAAESVTDTGIFAAPLGAGRVSVVAKQDLADIAVRIAGESERDVAAGFRSRHAGKTYELEGVTTVTGHDIAAALSELLDRPVTYRDRPLSEARASLRTIGLLPYQIANAMSLYANAKADLLEARHSDLPLLLSTRPRPVEHLIAAAVRAGGYESRSISARR
ncbi:NmrA family NAD(P)-binding protein [Nocardia sp. NPDC050710]|uniref:NAD(P)H-binding protein n=1 Tax=Nocardia sp. NPDC050710 TaxID=3157220 RepID=UPI0033FA5A70